MEKFTINGKEIVAKDFDFNMICEIGDQNINLENVQRYPHSFIRFYVAYCLGSTKEVAGVLIGEHIKKGGDVSEIMEIIIKKMDESEFFPK